MLVEKGNIVSMLQDLVMAARGKLKERNWRRSNGDPATIDDITVFVIPILPYKQELLGMQVDRDKDLLQGEAERVNNLDKGMEAMEIEKEAEVTEDHSSNVKKVVNGGPEENNDLA